MIREAKFRVLLVTFALAPLCVAQEKPHDGALLQANTRFAFKLFRQSVANTPDANVLTSPAALSLDFALLQNGAEPQAREEILSAFEFGNLSADEINEQSLAFRQALSYQPPKPPKPPRAVRGTLPPAMCCAAPAEQLILAGSLWTQPGVGFRHAFLQANKKFYSFQTMSVPNRGAGAVNAVNAWVAQQTGGTLTHAFDSWQRDDFLLVDTTWFKGTWIRPFLETRTHPGDFTLLSGQKKQVPMMAQGGHFAYLRGPKFQAVWLPYYHAAMYVFLPDEDSSLKEFEQSLTADNWASWVSSLSSREGYLELPRFHSVYRADVKTILTDLGVQRAFTAFSSFAPLVENSGGAALTRVLQVISLKVDEKGTEVVSAGISGGVIGGISGGPRPEPFRMIVNRPFFFAICDNQTHAILYMGAITDPVPLPATQ
jgi:serine protease inhibitor